MTFLYIESVFIEHDKIIIFCWSSFLLPKPKLFLYSFILSFLLAMYIFPLILKLINSYCKDFGKYKRTTRKLNLSIISSSGDEHFKSNFLLNLSYAYVCEWPLLHKLGYMRCFLIFLHSNEIWLYPSAILPEDITFNLPNFRTCY